MRYHGSLKLRATLSLKLRKIAGGACLFRLLSVADNMVRKAPTKDAVMKIWTGRFDRSSGRAALEVEFNEMILALKRLRLSSCEGATSQAEGQHRRFTRKAELTEILCFCKAGGWCPLGRQSRALA